MSSEPKDRRAAHMLQRVVGAYAGALTARAEQIYWILADSRGLGDPRTQLAQAQSLAHSLAATARALRFDEIRQAAANLAAAIESLRNDLEHDHWTDVEGAMVQLTRAADPHRAQA